jgi:hypothetical protein
MFRLATLALLALLQQPTTTVRGIISDAQVNRPLARVNIELQDQTGKALHVAITGEDGRFAIPGVVPRQHKLVAMRNGYVVTDPGDRARGGRSVAVIPTFPEIQVAMIRTVSVSGRITDRAGQPLVNLEVQALQLSYEEGRRRLNSVASARTNDLGEYRIYWLPPGRYYVKATPVATSFTMGISVLTNPNVPEVRNTGARSEGLTLLYQGGSPMPAAARSFGRVDSETEALVPVYFPATINEGEATPLDLQPGQDYRNANIVIEPAKWHRIKGVVMDAVTRQPALKSLINRVLLPASRVYFHDEADQADGRFEISALPGRYSLLAYTLSRSGRTEVEVKDRDIENVIITVSDPATLPARILIDGRPAPGGPEMGSFRVHLSLVPDMPGNTSSNGKPEADGAVALPFVQPANYRVAVEPFEGVPSGGDSRNGSTRPKSLVGPDTSRSGPVPPLASGPGRPLGALSPLPPSLSNAYVRTMRFANVELPDGVLHFDAAAFERQARDPQTLEIVIGTDGGTVQGTVADSPAASVVLVPNDPRRSRIDLYKIATADESGRFRLTAVAPGDYKIFAWEFVDGGAWLDPAFLRQYEDRGTPVRVSASAVATANPAVIP